MAGSIASGPKAEPNLTPILDMVFQLITFFMLVINFKSAELDQALTLPVVGSAFPVAMEGPVLVLNVRQDKEHPGGYVTVYGHVYNRDEIEKYIQGESDMDLRQNHMTLQEVREEGPDGVTKELPTTIVLRADRTTSFHVVNYVITLCQEYGYRKFLLNAMKEEKKDTK